MGSADIAIDMSTGKISLRVPDSYGIRLEGTLPLGVGAKDIAVEYKGLAERMLLADKLTPTNLVVETRLWRAGPNARRPWNSTFQFLSLRR